MNNEREKQLGSIVNASGFLFQERVADEIERNRQLHGWEVALSEYPWKDRETGKEGYIDMVLKMDAMLIVVECKRPRDGIWVFLVPDYRGKSIRTSRCLWTKCNSGKTEAVRWSDLTTNPGSHEAFFCAVRGKGEGDLPMLERLSVQLLNAVDSLAAQELMLKQSSDELKVYFPTVVTTAKLAICRYDPSKVSLENGEIGNGEGEFEEVSLVRFRKSLSTNLSSFPATDNLKQVAEESERTVFVIQASGLSDVLRRWSIEHGAPWIS
jgi:hypothetical protein